MKGFKKQQRSKNKSNNIIKLSKEQIINQAFKSHSQGNHIEAANYYRYFISQGFKDYLVYSNYGVLLKNHGKLKEAEYYYRKAIELKPDFAEAHTNLGNILRDLGKLQEAEFSQRKAIELNPHLAESHSNLGSILKDLGKLQDAKESTLKAIEIQPNNVDANYNLGSIYYKLLQLKEAEIYTRKAIEIKSNLLEANIQLAEVLFDLGKIEEASIYECKVIKITTSSKFLKSYRENAKLINKTALYVFGLNVLNHFKPIIEINPSYFEILVPETIDKEEKNKIRMDINNKEINIRSSKEIIDNKLIYERLVSVRSDLWSDVIEYENNVMIKRKVPDIKLLGQKNIRYMYTAGKNKYNIYSYWNKYYDGILCYGPYHEEKFKVRHGIPTSQMGYPRFDKYFNPGFERESLIRKFKCDPSKQTIVWLTTWSNLSSIEKYIKEISSLRKEYNIVVRPHPHIKEKDPENFKQLFTANLNYIDDNNQDNVKLYALADLMIFDYGGSMFGSLYLNKNFLFLDMKLESKNNRFLGEKSSEDYLKSFFPDRIAKEGKLKSICNYCLKNPPSETLMKSLREEFFNINYQGNSAKKAYELITTKEWLK